ncbi:MAG: MarR family winged helix-turn-helix transcriptional regulator [Friedmanniella sp.]
MASRQDLAQDQRGQDTSQLLDALSHLIRTARAASHREPAEYGLSGTPLGILKTLASGDARPGDLAARLQIAPSVVSRAVVPLERAGLVERRTDPVDGRAARLGLTAAGRQRLEEARQDVADRFTPLLDDWDSADVRTLTRLLTRLEETLCVGLGLRGHGSHEDHPTAELSSLS